MWPEESATQKWLEDVRRGEAGAVDRLLASYRRAVQMLVQMRLDRQVRRRVDVSDVVQEVLWEASRRLQDYLANPVMSFRLWIRQIACDRIIDTHRRHRTAAKRSVDREQSLPRLTDRTVPIFRAMIDPELTPAAQAAQRELVACVESAISRLSDQDAEVLILRHYERLSNQEVAQALGLSEAAAGMRYLRAVRRLRTLLAEKVSQESETA
ncbi:MAG: DNA-directed RNA polymerase sigma-70 factor [Pirellulaceae bacterium]|nr:MAG: DNA-directed RNA polymerase sigma-70 factor [Pirellulaceae bacterium]